ncbi:MAG: hypothetical protein SH807_03285 [Blastochloris sp.]|nr:hypothetical protein [Blastochloris sp.]
MYAGLRQPTIHPRYGLIQSKGTIMKTGVSSYANEGVQDRPAQVHWLTAAKNSVPPLASRLVVPREADLGIEEQICIGTDHWCRSPSVTASNSEMLS